MIRLTDRGPLHAMILRDLPDLRNASFRQWFYARWGRENAVIYGSARRAEYPPYTQALSLKMARGGTEAYFVDRRRIVVSDSRFLLLNAGRTYGSLIESHVPVESFAVFFRPGLAEEVLTTLSRSPERQLEDGGVTARPLMLSEHLRPADSRVVPVLRYIRSVVASGEATEEWLEEQLQFLAGRIIQDHYDHLRDAERLTAKRDSTRREIARRIDLARDFIESNLASRVTLHDVAAASHLSPYHLLRQFRHVTGQTPHGYLSARRAEQAADLLIRTELPMVDIAQTVGLETRSALFRLIRRHFRCSPEALRRGGARHTG